MWRNTATGTDFRCIDNTLTAAVWDPIGSGSGGYTMNSVTEADSPVTCATDNEYDNIGAAAAVTLNLPTAVRGASIRFVVMAAQDMIVTAAAGDQIHANGKSSTVAGTFTSDVLYSVLELKCYDATNWVAIAASGSWTEA